VVQIEGSRRYFKAKNLDINDIPGANVDVYRKVRHIKGRDGLNIDDIQGARP
jgi:hypothetical protein